MSGSVLASLGEASSRKADAASPVREHAADPLPAAGSATTVPLTALRRGASGVVAGVRLHPPGVEAPSDPEQERMALRLMEIGFVEGARLRVVAFGQPGDDPIGVRVGGRGGISTFALRRLEAACVWVWPDR